MAPRTRTSFTEAQKAQIYARDRATCAFSGMSLWIPEQGLTPWWHMDWADHLKPSAKGGKSTLENGACVSSTFNMKKRDNGSDNLCFFVDGHITVAYVRAFGLPGDDVMDGLRRRAALVPADWWFNRALANSLFALRWRVNETFGGAGYTRDDEYWIKAALRRHARWSRLREPGGFVERGLVPDPLPFGTGLLLQLESVETDAQYRDWLESLQPSYLATRQLCIAFDQAESPDERFRALDGGLADADVNPQVVAALSILAGERRAAA